MNGPVHLCYVCISIYKYLHLLSFERNKHVEQKRENAAILQCYKYHNITIKHYVPNYDQKVKISEFKLVTWSGSSKKRDEVFHLSSFSVRFSDD